MWGYGETVTRERRLMVPDPYNPDSLIQGTWDEVESLEVENCFIDSTSSSSGADATREPVSTTKTLYCTDPDVDVQTGDRIRRGADVFYVRERTEADRNPFTRWRPVVAIPLSMEEG